MFPDQEEGVGNLLPVSEKEVSGGALGPVKTTRAKWLAFVATATKEVTARIHEIILPAIPRLAQKMTAEKARSLSECITTEANTINEIKSGAVRMNANSDDAGTILRVRGASGMSREEAEQA